ncbi:MAG: hypothetical protein GQ583_00340 [Methyloprofundus sp.]|nr:hypothetical protein [Methyloprofundus sp.]
MEETELVIYVNQIGTGTHDGCGGSWNKASGQNGLCVHDDGDGGGDVCHDYHNGAHDGHGGHDYDGYGDYDDGHGDHDHNGRGGEMSY